MKYSVIVDGNRHSLNTRFTVELEQPMISVSKCKEITQKIESNFPIKIGELMISLYPLEEMNDPQFDNDKFENRLVAYYTPKYNQLMIYKKGMPIYENLNGEINRNVEALADSIDL